MKDATGRFSDRVENYIKYRPSYPAALLDCLVREAGFGKNSIVADVGSGTGIFTGFLAGSVKCVYGVEPNGAMRDAAEKTLGHLSQFRSVKGTAENTTLEDASVDFVTVAQAFHWFHRGPALREFSRILKKEGALILVWNNRLTDTPFLEAYEAALRKFANDYNEVNHQNLTEEDLALCFAGGFTKKIFANSQTFDLAGVFGRLLSSSYAPLPGSANYAQLDKAVTEAYCRHSSDGSVAFNYQTEVYWGRLTQ